ncbi:MAG: type II secretion system protein GspN, partial [Desulfobacterales bacterium]|nr:type II secretion system protein GspN [Desulfobacterales bacterium]
PLFVKSEACGGIIDGRVLLDSWVNGRPSRVRLNLKGIALERIAWLQTTAKRKISGTLAGKLLYDRKSPRETLRAGFKLTGLAIELRGPVFNMAALVFKTVDTDMVVNSQQLLVKRCVLAGEKVDGTLTGSLSLKSPAEKSVLQFSGVIKFHPDFRDHLEKKGLGTLLPKKKAGRKGGYPIQIFGTLDNPRFSLK